MLVITPQLQPALLRLSAMISQDFHAPAESEMSVKATVRGSAGKIFDSEVQFKVKVAVAPAPIILESDGQNPLTGICESAIVKSKSNISNN
jgi:hypothetical protein